MHDPKHEAEMGPNSPATSFLLLSTEWSPTTGGGVSAFNRALATALAEAGHRTACLVERADGIERRDARAKGVTLLTAERSPAGPSLLVPAASAIAFGADVVVGHDRFTGPAAWTYARKYLDVPLTHIVHVPYAETERYKNSRAATARTEEREKINSRIAADAKIVAAVGPRLWSYTTDLMVDGFGEPSVLQLDPGLDTRDAVARRPPARRHVLMLGRTDDMALKGLDIAARAIAAMPRLPGAGVTLLVRGAPEMKCDALHATLVKLSGLGREQVDVRAFTGDPAHLKRDLARSALCIMPSRVEGFGLVALDAIATGTPVLLSSKSGAAELLRAKLGRGAEPMIVEVTGHTKRDVQVWSAAIAAVMANLPGAFSYAEEVRNRLAPVLTWRTTATRLAGAVNAVLR